ncbi:hypothetical protein CEXT_800121 [Caerostris extrusa]|uniref:Uncharacterized protein n=1 Tax=Caerostris extrusa TaxID=172846 RepID=A0AAV4WQ42_CAEEX|nr:hypothetical protein CEXT_800121 [Caerostris extrusa]
MVKNGGDVRGFEGGGGEQHLDPKRGSRRVRRCFLNHLLCLPLYSLLSQIKQASGHLFRGSQLPKIFFPFTPLHSPPPLKQKPISTSKIQIHSSPSQFKPQQDRHSKNPQRDIVLSLSLNKTHPRSGPATLFQKSEDTPTKEIFMKHRWIR